MSEMSEDERKAEVGQVRHSPVLGQLILLIHLNPLWISMDPMGFFARAFQGLQPQGARLIRAGNPASLNLACTILYCEPIIATVTGAN